ncbi:MAG: T9SS type A sorting domain-containing protein [Bacteroidales bacterium]|nr:T9SS type A sorting domain-containing protein [Bacteroidales bacterium]
MKKNLLTFASGLMLMLFGTPGLTQVPMFPQTVVMGQGYANEVYYQFSTYNTTTVARDIWDISFRTTTMSSSILINDGTEAVLWAYPYADTSGWAAIDTFDLYTWPPLYNDPTDWENGAFCRNATGHPDYGWGVYNTVTHVITGDSIFLMKLVDGSFKKIWIVEKDSPENTYLFRYANLDGSDSHEITLDCNLYLDKDFIGFDMQTNLPVDYQPVKESWDILFTKYMAMHYTGTPYPVTGVLSNPAVYTKRFYPVDPDFNDWQQGSWDSTRSNIGWDWKWFDLANMVYVIEDSMVFYVQDQVQDVYRLVFTGFEGMSTGVIDFGIAHVGSTTGIGDSRYSNFHVSLYPNPASDIINVEIEIINPVNEQMTLTLMDMTGRMLRREVLPEGQKKTSWNINWLSPGAYFMVVSTGNDRFVYKFLKQ